MQNQAGLFAEVPTFSEVHGEGKATRTSRVSRTLCLLVEVSDRFRRASLGGAVRTNLELDSLPKVDPLEQSEKLIWLSNSLDFVRSILKNPLAMECSLTL